MNQQEITAASSIGLLYVFRMLGLFMVLPVLPLMVTEIPGATAFTIGLAIGIYGLSQAVLQIPFGLMSDRIGRKPMILIGLLLFIVGSFVAGMSDDITGLIIGRFLQGCGAIASTLLALLSDLTRVDQRSKSMAIVGGAIGASFGVSLVLGPLVAARWGIAGVFNLSGALGIAGLAVLIWRIPGTTVISKNLDAMVQRSRLMESLTDLKLWRLNFSVFSLHYLLVSAFLLFPSLFEATGEIESGDHWLYYLVLLIVSFVAMLPFMWLADRLSDIRPVLVSTVLLALISFCVLNVSHAYWPVLAAATLFFMAFNLLEAILPAQIGRVSAAGSRGTSMGIYTTCQFLGIFAGGAVSGWILSNYDVSGLLYVNIAIVLVWLVLNVSFPTMVNIGSRTMQLTSVTNQSPQERVDALLSIAGVIDAVIIESDQVAYLKVDEEVFDDQMFNQIVDQGVSKGSTDHVQVIGEEHGSRN